MSILRLERGESPANRAGREEIELWANHASSSATQLGERIETMNQRSVTDMFTKYLARGDVSEMQLLPSFKETTDAGSNGHDDSLLWDTFTATKDGHDRKSHGPVKLLNCAREEGTIVREPRETRESTETHGQIDALQA
jgi:hypothetical protein